MIFWITRTVPLFSLHQGGHVSRLPLVFRMFLMSIENSMRLSSSMLAPSYFSHLQLFFENRNVQTVFYHHSTILTGIQNRLEASCHHFLTQLMDMSENLTFPFS